jgi:hypothetical protein
MDVFDLENIALHNGKMYINNTGVLVLSRNKTVNMRPIIAINKTMEMVEKLKKIELPQRGPSTLNDHIEIIKKFSTDVKQKS